MRPDQILDNLRSKPYETRVRILWGTVIIIGIALVVIWIFSLRGGLKDLSAKDLLPTNQQSITSPESNEQYVTVERIERTSSLLKIYFSVNNPTNDILNFPTADDITLTVDDQPRHPIQIIDRQNQPFIVKVLSHTQNFGALVFSDVQADTGKLVVDSLSFEQNTDNDFHQDFDLNFNDLQKSSKLRN